MFIELNSKHILNIDNFIIIITMMLTNKVRILFNKYMYTIYKHFITKTEHIKLSS